MDEDEEDEDEDEDEDDEEEDDTDLRAALLMSQGLAADSTAPSIPAVDSTEESEHYSAATPGISPSTILISFKTCFEDYPV